MPIGSPHLKILCALARFDAMTATQVNLACFSKSSDSFAQRCLRDLWQHEPGQYSYIFRKRQLRVREHGSDPYVYFLLAKGAKLIEEAYGMRVRTRTPSELADNALIHTDHRLACNWFLIMARQLALRGLLRVVDERTDWELKQLLRGAGAIPDGLLKVEHNGRTWSFLLEVDRSGHEPEATWKKKIVETLTLLADGRLAEFQPEDLFIVVAAKDAVRRDQLRRWTEQQLVALGQTALGDRFGFGARLPTGVDAWEYFFTSYWTIPFEATAFSLLEAS